MAATWDAVTATVKVYRDGAIAATYTSAVVGFDDPGFLRMGNDGATTPDTEMNIAEVSIWRRTLTDDEVTALYAAGAGNRYPFSG